MNGRVDPKRLRPSGAATAATGRRTESIVGIRLSAWVRKWWRSLGIAAAVLVLAGLAFAANPSGAPVGTGPEAASPGLSRQPVASATSSPTTPPAPTPVATSVPSAAAPVTSITPGRPDPYIRSYAQQPGVAPLPPQPSPSAGVPLPVTVNGCDNNYGHVGQCVPVQFPASATDKCDWLADRNLAPLPVVGVDRHGLDRDGDGTACDPDDLD